MMSSMLSMRLVLLDLGDDGRVAAELFYPLLDLPDLVRRAHEGHGHPVRVELLHPETQVLDVLRREAPDGERGVREVQPLVGGDGAAFEDLADDLAVLDALDAQADEAVVDEQAVAGAHVVGQVLVGGGEPARVPDEVSGGDERPGFPPPAPSLPRPRRSGSWAPARPARWRRCAPCSSAMPAHDLGVLQVHAVLAVGEVEPRNVDPGPDEGPRWPPRRRSRALASLLSSSCATSDPSSRLTLGLKAARPG